mmetsp:Transcript_22341/g.46576  ORF Transcript_22341/g.46576 Transcript_22341/m.46576 type:complete len:218 (+) Transcript_22341:615-1268(+)
MRISRSRKDACCRTKSRTWTPSCAAPAAAVCWVSRANLASNFCDCGFFFLEELAGATPVLVESIFICVSTSPTPNFLANTLASLFVALACFFFWVLLRFRPMMIIADCGRCRNGQARKIVERIRCNSSSRGKKCSCCGFLDIWVEGILRWKSEGERSSLWEEEFGGVLLGLLSSRSLSKTRTQFLYYSSVVVVVCFVFVLRGVLCCGAYLRFFCQKK